MNIPCVDFFIFVTDRVWLWCGTSPEGPKMGHTFYYPMVKSSLFSISKRQTAHTKVIWYARNDGGIIVPIYTFCDWVW